MEVIGVKARRLLREKYRSDDRSLANGESCDALQNRKDETR